MKNNRLFYDASVKHECKKCEIKKQGEYYSSRGGGTLDDTCKICRKKEYDEKKELYANIDFVIRKYVCTACRQWLPKEDYHKTKVHKSNPEGIMHQCSKCFKAARMEHKKFRTPKCWTQMRRERYIKPLTGRLDDYRTYNPQNWPRDEGREFIHCVGCSDKVCGFDVYAHSDLCARCYHEAGHDMYGNISDGYVADLKAYRHDMELAKEFAEVIPHGYNVLSSRCATPLWTGSCMMERCDQPVARHDTLPMPFLLRYCDNEATPGHAKYVFLCESCRSLARHPKGVPVLDHQDLQQK